MKNLLFVFDLDFTIWDCGGTWCDHSNPPYRKENGKILDNGNQEMILYPDVVHVLEEIFHSGFGCAIASRTGESEWAEELMMLHEIRPYFQHLEMHPGSKIQHFKDLQKKTNIPYENMLFFDDEVRNIDEAGTLGVNCFLVTEGLNYEIYKSSLLQFSHKSHLNNLHQ